MSDDDLTLDLSGLRKPGRFAFTKSGYVIDRMLFRIFSVVFLTIMLIILFTSMRDGTYQQAWAYCPPDALGGQCDNALYGKCDLPACQKEILQVGEEIGTKPTGDSITEVFTFFMITSLIVLFVYNHAMQQSERYIYERNNYQKQERARKRRSVKKSERYKDFKVP